MSENHRSHMEKKKNNLKRNTAGPSSGSCDVHSSGTQNQQACAALLHLYRNTHYYKLLHRAKRIWKNPVPICKPKPISFQKRVEMLRNHPRDSDSPKSLMRCVRDLQLRSPVSSPSPSPSSDTSRPRVRRAVQSLRRRRFRQQLEWYRQLSHHRRRRQAEHRPQGQTSPAGIAAVKVVMNTGSEDKDHSDSSPVIRVPSRKTSRRLWRRQLDSSSSDNSPMTGSPRSRSRWTADTPPAFGTTSVLQTLRRSPFSREDLLQSAMDNSSGSDSPEDKVNVAKLNRRLETSPECWISGSPL